MRNKAAERAKVSYNSGSTGNSSSPLQTQGQQPVSSSGGGFNSAAISAISAAAAAESILQRPSYSINGILGLQSQQNQQQPDANANNINKRKRDDEEENRDLNGQPEDEEIKRARSGSYGDVYSNMAWGGASSPSAGGKWPQVKEEPKGINVQLPEILAPANPTQGLPGTGSPQSFQYSAPPPATAGGAGGFPPPGAVPPPSVTPEQQQQQQQQIVPPFTSSNSSTTVSTDLIYDSINMSSQVQNYSQSLSSSLGKSFDRCLV